MSKAWELLAEGPHRWTRGAYAKDKTNKTSVVVLAEEAYCFCMMGAIYRAYNVDIFEEHSKVLPETWKKLSRRIPNPLNYNDTHTYEEVLAVLKELDI